jgi:GSH-dependent disulfide-bond oxidoreductase
VIDLYTWATPNGRKVSIALEEMGLPYEVHPVDIGKNQQFEPDFQRISPNNRIPAIVDRATDLTLMESGAILFYLAEKTGSFLPAGAANRVRAIEWLMWQMGGFGPTLGQAHHFMRVHPDASNYARERYQAEARRLYAVLDRRLSEYEYAADEYSIADMAIWPWVSRYEWHGIDLHEFQHVKRWYRSVAQRPCVVRGFKVPDPTLEIPLPQCGATASGL